MPVNAKPSFQYPPIQNSNESTFNVTAENGLILRKNPDSESEKLGLIPFGSKIKVIEKTLEELTISDNGTKITGNWVKILTYNHPYFYSETEEFGYVFAGFLMKEEDFIQDLENRMENYPEFSTYEIDTSNHPYVLTGDFFGDGVNDLVIKIKKSNLITLGFINHKKENLSEIVILNKDNLVGAQHDFGWTERFETVSKNLNLWPEDEEMANLDVDFKHPVNKKFTLDYDALYGHNLESCGGGYIFWYQDKFHTITGD